MKTITFLILLFGGITSMHAQQFTYKPLNPAFGGDTFNYNWLLSSATVQNGLKEGLSAEDQKSELEQFGDNLNKQVLSQISRTLLQQQIEGIGDFTEEGTFTYGTLAVEVFESEEGLVINILDTSTGEQTQVIVPNQ
ncbi:MAG: curli assembly protein CsgF [Bacteroidota bacterium]|uniref:curli production assembly/transport component CsgF n=1 Tax=Leeuwenhoekiella palythoae TaxID=573501 RepID=UPI000EBFD941|nr:curli production assembly/transport component CsgF [Leeuwenhoekiella palythoae]MEC7783902.1 curli assembly protein CsgF [Bacteroidota bacterium]UBZ09504.1 curli assembly protein CsgF [Leeuwenhoekiella palythoae]HBO30654.1 curli assembly protein CsgF [Leeuwenhoekiella sp.]HCQ75209.1 curli assembly protein CsgF [Leeuwenhoekiella sp.]|tara:strand:- start:4549 stop:4959 length:411 start_codon:yes stop_codon:yes gene_type:complete